MALPALCPAPVTSIGMALHQPLEHAGHWVSVSRTQTSRYFVCSCCPLSPCICCSFRHKVCFTDELSCASTGETAASFLKSSSQQLRDALMSALTRLPPGAEDLALRALSCLLHPSLLRSVRSAAEEALQRFCASGSTLCEAALRQGAWRQEVPALNRHVVMHCCNC